MRRSNSIFATMILATVAAGFAAALAGCANGGGDEGNIQVALQGADQISLFSLSTGATANTKPARTADVVSAFVTIVEIDARVGGHWTTVVTTAHTIDLLKLDGKLDLDACVTGIVILDFDPKIKIEDEGSRREYELTARARIKTEELKGGCGGGNPQPDMAKGPDMVGTCGGVVCRMDQKCQAGMCVADCSSVVCAPPLSCHDVGGTPTCQ